MSKSCFPVWSLLAVLLLAPVAARAAPATEPAPDLSSLSYEKLFTLGQQMAQEASWARAEACFAEAVKKAPDADSRRWSELGHEDAAWRAEAEPAWDQRQAWA